MLPSDKIYIAAVFHKLMCHSDHAEGCGWYYTSPNSPPPSVWSARARYQQKAQAFIDLGGTKEDVDRLYAAIENKPFNWGEDL